MAVKTKMPLLKSVAELIIRKIGNWEKTIRQNLGEGMWYLVEFLIGLASLLVSLMEDNSNAEGDFLSPVNVANAKQINGVKALVAAYKSANGIAEDW